MKSGGLCLHEDSFIQGMSPFDEMAGADPWQTSIIPISACLPLAIVSDKEGGTTMLRVITKSTMTACHFINVLYEGTKLVSIIILI